jgi:opacity protein-like surface antigen
MKIKKLLLVAAALLGLTATSVAQNVPSYVPTNGLVGWWPFNGNANDESGNGNNGTVNGAVLSSDRFGNGNKSYNFNGTQNINITNSSIAAFLNNSFTCVAWFKTSSNLPGDIVRYDNCVTESGWGLRIGYNNPGQIQGLEFDNTRNPNFVTSNNVYNDGNWHLAVFKRDVSAMKDALFIDNQFITETSFSTVYNIDITGHPLFIGAGCDFFNGDLDDIGIWNRALNQQEITNFFNSSQSSSNCLPSYVPINGLIG